MFDDNPSSHWYFNSSLAMFCFSVEEVRSLNRAKNNSERYHKYLPNKLNLFQQKSRCRCSTFLHIFSKISQSDKAATSHLLQNPKSLMQYTRAVYEITSEKLSERRFHSMLF